MKSLLCWPALALCLAASPASAEPPRFAEYGPILPSEREAPFPSRDMPAAEFHDAFCAAWTDGCVACKREHVDNSASCAADPAAKGETCQRKAIVCSAMLPSAHRVCLTYFDGCNDGIFHGANGGLLCFSKGPDGKRRPRPVNFECTHPRARSYDSDELLTEEWNGLWRLRAPDGSSCRIGFGTTYPLSGDADCLKLPAVARFQQVEVKEGRFAFYGAYDGSEDAHALLELTPQTLDLLANADGWSLERLDPQPMMQSFGHADWAVNIGGERELCLLSLPTDDLSQPDGLQIEAPGRVKIKANCVGRTPGWTRWRPTAQGFELLDDQDRVTSFSNSRVSPCMVGQPPGGEVVALAYRAGAGGIAPANPNECAMDFAAGAPARP